ncbi:MAG: hypothetical protein GXO69_08255 [Acidobacteria bacterium]|nr:hypothetical protein [Acidobacteriota bacterium]
MKNALVLLIETAGTTLSGNTLASELSVDLARELSDYLTDLSISELYPVANAYDLFLLGYTPEETIRLEKRIGDNFRFFAGAGKTQLSFLTDAAMRLEDYDRIIFLKSNSSGISEETVAGFFQRMHEFDLLFGPSGSSFYLFGIHREILPFIDSLSGLSQEEVDDFEIKEALHGFHMPARPIAETISGLTDLREKLTDESGLARKIDDIIIRATAVREEGDS